MSKSEATIEELVSKIERGELRLPEMQRQYVWRSTRVRDLLDSLYRGFPSGAILLWETDEAVPQRDFAISQGKNPYRSTCLLLDGQQRLTSLSAVIRGQPVSVRGKSHPIEILFNLEHPEQSPVTEVDELGSDEEEDEIKPIGDEADSTEDELLNRFNRMTFVVATRKLEQLPQWVKVSDVFKTDDDAPFFERANVNSFKDPRYVKYQKRLARLRGIRKYSYRMDVLEHTLSYDEVTEIFVRINTKGTQLNQADFAMSKIAADSNYGGSILRKAIDYFCHLAVKPEFYMQMKKDKEFLDSEYAQKIAWMKDSNSDIYNPDYNDVLRVAFMFAFDKRSKLSDLVSLLSGRDFADRKFKEEIAEQSFKDLKRGVLAFINAYNFEQFTLAITSAGFISPKLLNSQMTLNFAYTLYLRLHESGEIQKSDIKKYVQKWFIFTTLTSRYITSPETRWGQDLRTIAEKGFLCYFTELELAELSDNFWDVQLVSRLETSSSTSPYFNTFIAAQIWNADRSLLSASSKVSDLLSAGDMHHIFPREYLKQHGIREKSQYNQVANYVYLDTSVNIAINKKAPNEYFRAALRQALGDVEIGETRIGTLTSEADFWKSLEANSIPVDVMEMTSENYLKFLQERRRLMAKRIKDYYYSL